MGRTTAVIDNGDSVLLDALPVGVVVQDRRGVVVRANEAACATLGVDASALVGASHLDAPWPAIREDGSPFPPEEQPAIAALRTGEVQREVVLGVHVVPRGEWRWLIVTSQPLPGVGVMSTFVDVTDRIENWRRLDRRLRIEQLLRDVAHDMMHLEGDALDGSVTRVLSELGEMLGVDGMRVFVLDDEHVVLENPYWWSRSGGGRVALCSRFDLPALTRLRDTDGAVFHRDELPEPAREELALLGLGDAATVLAVGLVHDGDEFGSVVCTTDGRREWSDDDVAIVRHVSALLAAMLATRRAARERQNAERFLATIVGNSADVILRVALDGRVTYVSPNLEKVTGYRPDELRSLDSVFEIVHPDDRDLASERFTALTSGAWTRDDTPRVELRIRHAAGTSLWMEITGDLLVEDGVVTGVVLNARDVTDRHDQQAALEEVRRRLAEVWEHSPVGMAIVSLDGEYLAVNPAHERITGHREEDVIGRHVSMIVYEDDVDALIAATLRMMEEGGTRTEVDARLHRKDGETAWGRIGISLVTDADGEPLYAIGTVEDVTERRRLEGQLAFDATHDSLTGLPERTLVLELLGQALTSARRRHTSVAVLFLDLDWFKRVNDSLGHSAGDEALRQLAARLQSVLRESDVAGRIGGDEFVVLCPDLAEPGDVWHVADRVTSIFESPFTVEGVEVFLSASVGVSVSDGKTDAEELLRQADAAAYRAKRRGRRRYEVFDEELREHVDRRFDVESALRRALETDELTLCYQPIVDARTGKLCGMEGLVRWYRPGHGLVLPPDFLDVAEDAGLIVAMGARVLEVGCAQLAAWQRGPWPDARLSLNLSTRQLVQADFVEELARCIERTGVDPCSLFLEITETSLVEDLPTTIPIVEAVKEMGVRFSIDDFGTGYSSLSQLRLLPVDVLKLDRSFVAQLDETGGAVIASIVQLASALDKVLVVEGVEERSQMSALLALGCRLMQGFYFSRPLSAVDVERILRGRKR
ncbi:MAG: hypothetical protein KatS3mg009_1117 [Acidimicrobiia bacterium]|nr:MAG: hypothetical protein KatS3mg009_1117 [Acidimicrobiia bacterium]